MEPDRRDKRRPASLLRLTLCAAVLASGGKVGWVTASGQDTFGENLQRLTKMTVEEKAGLSKKKGRFDDLPRDEQERLRDLHTAIANDPRSHELSATIQRYNQWLQQLSLNDRTAILGEKDPARRVAKIKEMVQAQEESRFRDFLKEYADSLKDEDKVAFFQWFADFTQRHEELLVSRMPEVVRRRYQDSDESGKRRHLMVSWSYQYREREKETPVPTAAEIEQLIEKLSLDARKPFATPEQRQSRVIMFMRAVAFSRNTPSVTREELEKFYHEMPPGDPRRAVLENLEGEALRRELQNMWNRERWPERGGPGRGPPPPGFSPGQRSEGPRPDGPPRDGPRSDRGRSAPGGKGPPE